MSHAPEFAARWSRRETTGPSRAEIFSRVNFSRDVVVLCLLFRASLTVSLWLIRSSGVLLSRDVMRRLHAEVEDEYAVGVVQEV